MTGRRKDDIATVLCPRYPIGIEGLDFGDGSDRPIPGGFCVFAVDLPASLSRIAELRSSRGSRWPYLCSDLERGAGQQIAGLTRLPPAMALGAAADPALAEAAGRWTAREARGAGIGIVFAPVVDVADEPRNPIVATRAFSAEPDEVASTACAFLRGVQSEGIVATAKHFPGHGATIEDSHLELPLLERTREQLARIEEIPFRAAIEHGVRAMMIGHLHATALDGDSRVPTSLSAATISGYLRRDLGFRGAVFTDALDMGAIPQGDPSDPATDPSVRTLIAGADVALLPKDPHAAARAILAAVERGILPESRLRDAAERIRSLTSGFEPPAAPELRADPAGRDLALAIARASITLGAGSSAPPALRGRDVDVLLIDDGRGVARFPVLRTALADAGIRARVVTESDLAADSRESGEAGGAPRSLLVATFSDVRCNKGRVVLSPADSARVTALQARRGAIELSIGCPQALHAVPLLRPRLYAYDDDDASLTALAEVLAGASRPTGTPVFRPRRER